MKIIVGLGNPGEKYRNTRHNIGYMAADALAKHYGLGWRENKKLKAQITNCDDVYIVKPLTFMNESGQSVYAIMNYFKILPKVFGLALKEDADLSDKLIVIHDDLDIELGKYKVTLDSRSAGHRGVESLINLLKTKKFKRFRIGIRTDRLTDVPAEKFVLERFSSDEQAKIDKIISEITPELIK